MQPAKHPELSYALQSLLSYLEKEYYTPIEQLSGKVANCITEIHHGDIDQSASLYTSLSKKLVEQVGRYVRLRRLSLLPYLNELAEKEDDGHDCRTCSTSCGIRHGSQLTDIQDAHGQIRDTLAKLRSIEEPLPHEAIHSDWDKMLRGEIVELDELLSELLFLEETALIPKITDAQKAIHAHG